MIFLDRMIYYSLMDAVVIDNWLSGNGLVMLLSSIHFVLVRNALSKLPDPTQRFNIDQ